MYFMMKNAMRTLWKACCDTSPKMSSKEFSQPSAKKEVANPLDVHINGILSGAQQQRVRIAVKDYEMLHKEKEILILDEPTSALDKEVALTVLQNLFRTFHDRTIIIISHICKCQLSQLGINWTHRLRIEEGVIYNA